MLECRKFRELFGGGSGKGYPRLRDTAADDARRALNAAVVIEMEQLHTPPLPIVLQAPAPRAPIPTTPAPRAPQNGDHVIDIPAQRTSLSRE